MHSKRAYFQNSGMQVVDWWNPAVSHAVSQYARGNRIVESLSLELGADALVLDAACGKGRASLYLTSRFRTIALDISKEMLSAFDPAVKDTCSRVAADVALLPFADRTFDAIVCLEALVHFDSPECVLAEFRRVLKPGGFLLVSYDNKWGLLRVAKDVVHFVIGLFNHKFRLQREQRRAIFTPLANSELRKVIEGQGFNIERREFIGVIMPFTIGDRVIFTPKRYNAVKPILERLDQIVGLRQLATYVYVTARRPMVSSEHPPLVDNVSSSVIDIKAPSRGT